MIAHLINCTYCINRQITPGDKGRHIPEVERCKLTARRIPAPAEAGRFCGAFHQLGHDCKSCVPNGYQP